MDLGLKGRVAIVAASSEGLGRAVAMGLAREGARLALCARTRSTLESTAEEIRQATGAEVLAAPVDVTAYDEVRRFVNQTRERFGQVDICVTNAGGPPSKAFSETTIEDWQAGVKLNLMSTLYFARCHHVGKCQTAYRRPDPFERGARGGERAGEKPLERIRQRQRPGHERLPRLYADRQTGRAGVKARSGARRRAPRDSGAMGEPDSYATPRHAGGVRQPGGVSRLGARKLHYGRFHCCRRRVCQGSLLGHQFP